MSELSIKVLGRDEVEIDGIPWGRQYFEATLLHKIANVKDAVLHIGAREILCMMDEFVEPKPAENPTWEPGMLIRFPDDSVWRVDQQDDGVWYGTSMQDGKHAILVYSSDWRLHRLPHEFKVGDWFQWRDDSGKYHGPFQVKRIDKMGIRFDQSDYMDNAVSETRCRYVPPPKKDVPIFYGGSTTDPKPDPFQGPHWDALENRGWYCMSYSDQEKCVRDLRDEVRRLREHE